VKPTGKTTGRAAQASEGGREEVMKAYINYPNPHMTIHADSACGEIKKMQKTAQRDIVVNPETISDALNQLTDRGFKFAPHAAVNDVWLTVSFNDAEFEEAVAKYVCRIIGKRYRRLNGALVRKHC
jgi:hypothetical protein